MIFSDAAAYAITFGFQSPDRPTQISVMRLHDDKNLFSASSVPPCFNGFILLFCVFP
jgi:hypothetical protein